MAPDNHAIEAADPKGRRDFLRSAAALSLGVIPVSAVQAVEQAAAVEEPLPVVYLSLSGAEAAFVERLVNVMCPADDLTPDGVSCGLAVFIDRQLASAFGHGERLYLRGPWRGGIPQDGYQLPQTPEAHFKLGLRLVDEHCVATHGRRFAELDEDAAEKTLRAVSEGAIGDTAIDLARWFNELVYPLFEQACFADPIYGGNRGKVFWKMIGYPGLPAVNGLNFVKFRGKPFPGASAPKSMEDFA